MTNIQTKLHTKYVMLNHAIRHINDINKLE